MKVNKYLSPFNVKLRGLDFYCDDVIILFHATEAAGC